ncbi:olfactory receptor 132 [Cricetulus griseus]
MLVNFGGSDKIITYYGCATQLYIFLWLGATECVLLVVMALDRYVAVCHPLRYTTIMHPKVCLQLAFLAWGSGLIQSLIQSSATLRLPFCSHRVVDDIVCEVPALIQLSSADTTYNEVQMSIASVILLVLPLVTILSSYGAIVKSVLRIKSTTGQKKAFGTCTSHLLVVSLFYGTVTGVYLQPKTQYAHERGKFLTLFYTVITPTLNPLIYTLRNKESLTVILSSNALVMRILIVVLVMPSPEGRHKALSTCSSHLLVVTLFYGSGSIAYLRPKASHSPGTDKFLALFYTAVTSMLNPIIYSLRNKEVKIALRRTLGLRNTLTMNRYLCISLASRQADTIGETTRPGLCPLPAVMADFKKAPGGRETPQGELWPEVVEDEAPRSLVAEEPGGGGSNSSETKLSPREEEELDPRIQEELEDLNQASEINQEMVFVAEQGVMADKNRLDPTWQEMLNYATCKVKEVEEECLRGEREHQRVTRLCQQAEARVQALQKTLRWAIGRSRPYFELKAQFSQILKEDKAKVTELEQQVAQAKTRYSVGSV